MQWSKMDGTEDRFASVDAGLDTEDARTAATSVWRAVTSDLLPAHPDGSYDLLRVELWPDTGRTIFFPAREPFSERTDDFTLQVSWVALQAGIAALDDEHELDDDAHEDAQRTLVARVVTTLREAYGNVTWRAPLRVRYLEWGDEVIAEDVVGR